MGENAIAEQIVVRILVRTDHGTEVRRLRTDFGVGTEYEKWPEKAGIIVTPDCTLGIDALKNLIAEAIFEYRFDEKDDSRETQWYRFIDEAHTAAAKLLLSKDEGAAEAIRYAARTHLVHLLPDDGAVQLRKRPVPGQEVPDVDVGMLRDEQTDGAE